MLVIELEGVRIRREQEDQVNSMQVTLDSMPIPEDVEGQEAIAKLQDLLLKRKREMEELEREEEAMDLEDSVATMTSSADAGRLSSGLITRDFAPPLPSSRHAGKIKLKIRKRLKENPSSPSSSRQDEAGSVEKSGRLLVRLPRRGDERRGLWEEQVFLFPLFFLVESFLPVLNSFIIPFSSLPRT